MVRTIAKTIVVAGVSAVMLAGCGSDNDIESDGSSNVVRVLADPSTLALNQGSIIRAEFSFASDDVFDDNQDVVLVVNLPATVRYRAGTAEIKRPIDDRSVIPEVISCGDGHSLLRFRFDESELTDAENPSGDADAVLSFTVDAVARGNVTVVSAQARNNALGASCDSVGEPQSSALISVI